MHVNVYECVRDDGDGTHRISNHDNDNHITFTCHVSAWMHAVDIMQCFMLWSAPRCLPRKAAWWHYRPCQHGPCGRCGGSTYDPQTHTRDRMYVHVCADVCACACAVCMCICMCMCMCSTHLSILSGMSKLTTCVTSGMSMPRPATSVATSTSWDHMMRKKMKMKMMMMGIIWWWGWW